MPKPVAICIENLDVTRPTSRYLRCVALPGRQPGLRLDKAGRVQWQRAGAPVCELWVSADEHLILYRQEGMVPVKVTRAGRSLEAPCAKPVVLLDQDQIEIGRRKLRVHIHGEAPAVSAPAPLVENPSTSKRLAQAAATAALIGSALTAGGCTELNISSELATPTPAIEVRVSPPVAPTVTVIPTPTIEVRVSPPEVISMPIEPTSTPMATATPTPTATVPNTPVGDQTISMLIQGGWRTGLSYDMGDERKWISGVLTLSGNSYTFAPEEQLRGTPVVDTLKFLTDHPEGEVEITYAPNVTPDMTFKEFLPGKVLATVVFRAGGETSDEFTIQVKDANNLELVQPAGKQGYWRIYKQLR